jgi:glucose/arabinose dehydrogenase
MIARYRVSASDPNVADPASATTIFFYPGGVSGIHFGGWTAFGPDGKLFVAWGEAGASANAPDITDNPLGKLLRFDVNGPDGAPGTSDDDAFPADANRNYCVPADNPFVGVEGDDEIWAYGLRNPWRNSFDRLTGDLYIADVGAATWEEVNFAPPPPAAPGRNYGWPCMEGFFCAGTSSTNCACNNPSLTPPVYAYGRTLGGAISGGYVYRGCAMPWLSGLYVFGDYVSRRVWTARFNGTALVDVVDRTADVWAGAAGSSIYSFGQDARGELYISSGSAIYKLVPVGAADQCNCGSADYNGDGDYGTDQDIEVFFRCLAGDCPLHCDIWCTDFNGDGDYGTDQDIEAFFRVLAGGYC